MYLLIISLGKPQVTAFTIVGTIVIFMLFIYIFITYLLIIYLLIRFNQQKQQGKGNGLGIFSLLTIIAHSLITHTLEVWPIWVIFIVPLTGLLLLQILFIRLPVASYAMLTLELILMPP